MDRRRRTVDIGAWTATLGLCLLALVGRAGAHGGSLGAGSRESLTVPTWLFLATGGAVVGASFLLATLVTDRSAIDAVHGWRRQVAVPARGWLRRAGAALGVGGLVAVVAFGVAGPPVPEENAGYLLVWVGWWAGLVMAAYLVGNAWPALNPWRTLAAWLPSANRSYPERLGAWPAVVGLLALVWLEVVGLPLGGDLAGPAVVVTLAVGYTAVTLAGGVLYGRVWFDRADPLAAVFRYYGAVAPLAPAGDGLTLRPPGAGLDEDLLGGRDEVAVVVALLWATTFDGVAATPVWRGLVRPLVLAGVPARLAYLLLLVTGFALFLGVYLAAVRASRRVAVTHANSGALAAWFAPPLLAIAAGYHLAHYLGLFLQYLPALLEALAAPLAPATGSILTLPLPTWFGGVGMAAVLLGHLLAVWVAHAIAFDRFPGRLQAIRSQYPFVVAMVLYTMTSLWILTQPTIPTPYV